MATYFPRNSETQAAGDGLQTLILMNPTTYVQYASEQPPPSPPKATKLMSFSQGPPPLTQPFVGIPLPAGSAVSNTQDSRSQFGHHDMALHHGFMTRVGHHYNTWNSSSVDPAPARESCSTPQSRPQGQLSLSLSPRQANHGPLRVWGGGSSASGVNYSAVSGIQVQGVALSSKYLKAAQDLLEEVVNVGSGTCKRDDASSKNKGSDERKLKGQAAGELKTGDSSPGGDKAASQEGRAELTTVDRHEIQMKKAKLMSMLEEVEQRYWQYHQQMQIVIASFEQVAGVGSAKTYTALALKTISKQFRCLRDAIAGQVRAASKNLGEEGDHGGKIEGSRLKFVDHHFRQQRALQQLGMVQHNNAWRPQRGLPERAVSVLRSWLFEHFLHPYPKDSDKQMLAKQTGLTRSQVSNWFINARVRLWKPMVEEMYLEEAKEKDLKGSEDKTSKSTDQTEDSASKSSAPQSRTPGAENYTKAFKPTPDSSSVQNVPSMSNSTNSASPVGGNVGHHPGLSFISSSDHLEGIPQVGHKKLRTTDGLEPVGMRFGEERQSRDNYSIMRSAANFTGGFEQYPIGDMGRFDSEQFTQSFHGNGVSLTLGLPHGENLSLYGAHHDFLTNQNIQLGRRLDAGQQHELGSLSSSRPNSSSTFESMNIKNRKRFAVPLLPDFVT